MELLLIFWKRNQIEIDWKQNKPKQRGGPCAHAAQAGSIHRLPRASMDLGNIVNEAKLGENGQKMVSDEELTAAGGKG